jgi:hypothetical protein
MNAERVAEAVFAVASYSFALGAVVFATLAVTVSGAWIFSAIFSLACVLLFGVMGAAAFSRQEKP